MKRVKKTENTYPEKEVRLARYAKALGHPARIAIMRQLASLDKCCFNDISRQLPLAGSTVTQHLEELKDAGLIEGAYEPPNVNYNINPGNWKKARKYFRKFFNSGPGRGR